MRYRLLIIVIASVITGCCSGLYQAGVFGANWEIAGWGAGDLTWPLVAARDFVAGADPYARPQPPGIVGYPFTAALLVSPLALFPLPWAAGLFIGLSTALLTWGLTRDGSFWRLWILACYPFWQCVQVANWSVLILAIGFIPALYPLLVVKPQIGLPIALTYATKRRVALAALLVGVSLLLFPSWPIRWLGTLAGYAGRPAILLPFGGLLLFAALNWREPKARYFLLCCIVPLRAFYDYLLLFLIPASRRSLLLLVLGSWVQFWLWFYQPDAQGLWTVLCVFAPCLVELLLPWVRARVGRARIQESV